MRYTEAQRLVDDAVPIGNRYYWKSSFSKEVGKELAGILHRGADCMPSPRSMILLFEMKGAIHRVPKNAMAFDHRDANFEMSIIAEWTNPTDDATFWCQSRDVQWLRELSTAFFRSHSQFLVNGYDRIGSYQSSAANQAVCQMFCNQNVLWIKKILQVSLASEIQEFVEVQQA
jgi:hypothetical protein